MALLLFNLVPAAIFLYSSYWSFAVRRALVNRSYRYHALSLGAISLFVGGSLANPFNDIANYIFIAMIVGFFFFVDSTIPVARRSDPLLRSILSWERYRRPVWVVFAVLMILWIAFDAGGLPLWGVVAILIPAIVGIPALLIGGRRSGDAALRGSLKWVGVAFLFFFGAFFIYIILAFAGLTISDAHLTTVGQFIVSAPLILAAYSFYKSAKSLAPLNRLEGAGLIASPSLETGAIRPKPSLMPR